MEAPQLEEKGTMTTTPDYLMAALGALFTQTLLFRRKLNRHAAYLDELGELAKAFSSPGWNYERNAWRDLRHPNGQMVPVPVR
jgi:hypothetical protein